MDLYPDDAASVGGYLPVDAGLAESFLRRFIESGSARRLLALTASEHDRLARCAARSFRHANNFEKIVLGLSPRDGRKLVWHRWLEPETCSAPDIHNHRWDFVSYVATGKLQDTTYRPAEQGKRLLHYRYNSPEQSTEYSMDYKSPETLAESEIQARATGSYYFQPYAKIHCSIPAAPGTNTLIVQGPVMTPVTDVYLTSAEAGTIERSVNRIERGNLKRILLSLLDCLPA